MLMIRCVPALFFSEISVQGAYYHTLNTWSSIKTALHAQINYNPEK